MNKHKSNKQKKKTLIQWGTCKWDRSPPLKILLRSHKSGTPDNKWRKKLSDEQVDNMKHYISCSKQPTMK